MRIRSHRFPLPEDAITTDTTYYDAQAQTLDIGYQALKIVKPEIYPNFAQLQVIFMDYNALQHLPPGEMMPNLRHLSVRANQLTAVPLYPELRFLNAAENRLTCLPAYRMSKLRHLDVSNNPGFVTDIHLPMLRKFFVNDTQTAHLDLTLMPNLEILDCSCNTIRELTSGDKLVEINCSKNTLSQLPLYPAIVRINAAHNVLTQLPTYPKIRDLIVSYNRLTTICQPTCRRLSADHNMLTDVASMPEAEYLDLGYNHLTQLTVTPILSLLSVQFNQVRLDIPPNHNLTNIQIGYWTLQNFLQNKTGFHRVTLEVDADALRTELAKICPDITSLSVNFVHSKFCKIRFDVPVMTQGMTQTVFGQVATYLFWHYRRDLRLGKKNLQEMQAHPEYRRMNALVRDIFYRTVMFDVDFSANSNA